MDERVLSFRVGIVVVTAVMLGFILILLFGAGPQVFTDTYTVKVRFPRAPGVSVNTPVLKSGVKIGRVTNVELLREGGVILTLRLDGDKPVLRSEVPRISTGSLVTGDAVVEFVNPDRAGSGSREEPDPPDEDPEQSARQGASLLHGV